MEKNTAIENQREKGSILYQVQWKEKGNYKRKRFDNLENARDEAEQIKRVVATIQKGELITQDGLAVFGPTLETYKAGHLFK